MFKYYELNALDKNRKRCASWCEDCDKVFDNLIDTDIHRDVKKHRVKVIEFWTISRK